MPTLSSEQQLFIDKALEGNNILVDACIGSGKTTAIQHLCNAYPYNTRILYLTYNKLLKLDAKSKIKKKNVVVTNYHGYAWSCLARKGVQTGVSDLIQTFIKENPPIQSFDVLILDEYQDIELELAEMLNLIKEANPKMQIVAVGDMQQKIYDKTTLNVSKFINEFLGEHIRLEFTQCFRLSTKHAATLGSIWSKTIVGVNPNCKVETMSESEVVKFLAEQEAKDVLCLGARTGSLSKTLNKLEEKYPEKYNKYNVYASISDSDSLGHAEPDTNSAIFTTYDASKGLERKIAVLFDFTESYWTVRINKPQQSYEILRNIFCVAASRGKERIIFVQPDEDLLSPNTLSSNKYREEKFDNIDISCMFDFKYKENVEECFSLIKTKKINIEDKTVINAKTTDGLIDLSPCLGTYQEASYFNRYDIDEAIKFQVDLSEDKKYLITEDIMNASIERKILFLTALETNQHRYRKQVDLPFIEKNEKDAIRKRLQTVFSPDEEVQVRCSLDFADAPNGKILFSALGICDVLKDDVVYELKFVSELTHEHFLQCASYIVALKLKKGIIWNVRNNEMCEITIPDVKRFLDAVTKTVTKGVVKTYNRPSLL